MTGDDVHAMADEVAALLAGRLGARGRTLARRLRRAGRRLPRHVAREARYLAQADDLARNPRLLRMIDPDRVIRAHALLRDHLRGIDPAAARLTRILGILAVIAFNLLVLAALLLALLAWRGYL
jgi:hypothetical protein